MNCVALIFVVLVILFWCGVWWSGTRHHIEDEEAGVCLGPKVENGKLAEPVSGMKPNDGFNCGNCGSTDTNYVKGFGISAHIFCNDCQYREWFLD